MFRHQSISSNMDETVRNPAGGICANCGELTSQRCGSCRQVFYCKKECQKLEWNKGHKEHCRPVKVEKVLEDRYLVATKDLKAGDIIYKEEPLVVGPSQITEPICLSCYRRVNGKYRCSKCTWPLCGPKCEGGADHLPECVVGQEIGSPIDIQNFNETNHFYEIIMVLRCLTLKKSSPKKYAQLLDLVSHYEARKGTPVYQENQKRIVNMLRNYFMLVDYPPEVLDSSEYTIHRMTGIIDVNAAEITLPESTILGLYKTFSMMEHSCIPNVKFVFNDKRQVIVKAAVDIKEGEHLSIMYTHILWGTQARREHLKLNKYFMCTCKRCCDPFELGTNLSSMRCQTCPMGYVTSSAPLNELADWVCSKCNAKIPVEKIKALILEVGEEIEQVLNSPSLEDLEHCIMKLESTLLHPNHFHLFPLKHALLQMYGKAKDGINEETVKKKEKLCQEILTICNILDPGITKLGVYVSVTLYELHVAILSRRRQITAEMDSAGTKKDLETAKVLLKQCIQILQYEENSELLGLANNNLSELENWSNSL